MEEMSHNILYFIALVSRKTLMRTFVFGNNFYIYILVFIFGFM